MRSTKRHYLWIQILINTLFRLTIFQAQWPRDVINKISIQIAYVIFLIRAAIKSIGSMSDFMFINLFNTLFILDSNMGHDIII